jgi:hypothetical protein
MAETALEGRIAALEAVASGLSGAPPATSESEVSAVDVFAAAMGDGNLAPPTVPTAVGASNVLAVVDGEPITVAKLVESYRDQQAVLKAHRKEIDSLKSSTFSTGVKVGSIVFESFEDLVAALQSIPDIDHDAFAACTDAVSIFSHHVQGDSDTEKQTTELKAVRAAGIFDPTCCTYLSSFRQKHPTFILQGSKSVPTGSRFPIFASRSVWEGQPGMDSFRDLLLQTVEDARDSAMQYISDHVPSGSFLTDLGPLSLSANITHEWWKALETHITKEIRVLGQYGIAEDKVYTLLSDELQIIFRALFEIRNKLQAFSVKRDPLIYHAKCIWITMQAHMKMKEFLDLKFGAHTLISALFNRFHLEQSGNAVPPAITTAITKHTTDINTVKTKATAAHTKLEGRVNKQQGEINALKTKCGG